MNKKVSLKDIAEKLGVSIALVSYVLNDKKQDRISKTVAQKIKDMAAELNYQTNQIARSLKTKKTFTIGLVVADISNAFSSSLARIIEHEAEKYQYTVLFASSDESAERSQKLVSVLLNHQVDGLIIAPTEHTETQMQALVDNGTPFVLIDRYFEYLEASYVAIDNYKAAFVLVQHLVDAGRNRIGLINYKTTLINLQERKRGYIECLAQNDLPFNDNYVKQVELTFTKEQVEQAIDELLMLSPAVDAIFFTSNTLSLYGLKHLNTKHIKIPAELAVVAFDQSDAADLFYSPLTHIKQPLKEMGEKAVALLMENIAGKSPVLKLNLQAELVIRQSSGV